MSGYPEVVVWSCGTFLAPLPSPSVRTTEGPFIPDGLGDVNQPLVRRFATKLAKQHNEKSVQKAHAVDEAQAALMGFFSVTLESDFAELERRWKCYETAKNMKSDREISGPKWTSAKLERYVHRQDIAFVQPESRFDLTGESLVLPKICERVDLAMKAVSGCDGTVAKLLELHNQPNSTEFNTRMILDAIVQPLCVYKGLTLRSEITLRSQYLPSNRYDYIMYYETYSPIGVVEAKRQGCLKDDSVVQLLVQLLLLSEGSANNEFYFGVLSDAYRFIFAGVSKQKVWFFQTSENQLEITTVNSDDDVRSIVGKMSWLIDLAIQSRESIFDPIEEFLKCKIWTPGTWTPSVDQVHEPGPSNYGPGACTPYFN